MKASEDAAQELPLNDEKLPVKKNRHIIIALNHVNKRREALLSQREKLDKEIAEADAAIKALE